MTKLKNFSYMVDMVTQFFLGIPYPKRLPVIQAPLRVALFKGQKFLGLYIEPKNLIFHIDEVKYYVEKHLALFATPQPPLYSEIPFIVFPDISLGS